MKKYLVIFLVLTTTIGYSQCQSSVTVANGSELINGTTVTATPFGITTTFNPSGCPFASPYVLGNTDSNQIQGDGEYLFDFSPSVEAVTINISGINHYNPQDYEEIELLVNGQHYDITSAGSIGYCGNPIPSITLPVITPAGNLADTTGDVSFSACQNLTISGDIHSLSLKIHMVGRAYGVRFSLRICETDLNSRDFETQSIALFPNPSSQQSTLQVTRPVNHASLKIIDLYGHVVKFIDDLSGDTFLITYENLSAGMYFLELNDKERGILRTKMIID